MCHPLQHSTTSRWANNLRNSSLGVILALLPLTLCGQDKLVITGSIIDFASIVPLEAVNVTIVGTEIGDATNRSGIYSIEISIDKIFADSITVKADHIGYSASTTTLNLKPGAVILNIQLHPVVLQSVEMTIKAPRLSAPRPTSRTRLYSSCRT